MRPLVNRLIKLYQKTSKHYIHRRPLQRIRHVRSVEEFDQVFPHFGKKFPGMAFSPFRNIGSRYYSINNSVKRIRLKLIANHPEVLNFNYVSIWCRDENGVLHKYQGDFSCAMSSTAKVLPDPHQAMLGDGANTVTVHSKREVNPWWEVEFPSTQNVEFIRVYNRKDIWGKRSDSLVVEGYDEADKLILKTGRRLRPERQDQFANELGPLINSLTSVLKGNGHQFLAKSLEQSIRLYVIAPEGYQDIRSQLELLIQQSIDALDSPTPDLGEDETSSVEVKYRNIKHIRVVGFRKRRSRPVSVVIKPEGAADMELSEVDASQIQDDIHQLRKNTWSLLSEHVFEVSFDTPVTSVKVWAKDRFSSDAFVQRYIEVSSDGVNWTRIDTTLNQLDQQLKLFTLWEWLIGGKWSNTFVTRLGYFLATYRMSQARTAKPLLRANRTLLIPFIEGVTAGGKSARYLPAVTYTRHGLTVPFSELDSQFLADKMKDFAVFLEEAFGLKAFPCYGTLLGIYRDGDFLPHDDDIDLAVVVDIPSGLNERQASQMWAEKFNQAGIATRFPTPTCYNMHCYFSDFDMDLFFIYRQPNEREVKTHMEGYQIRTVKRDLLEPVSRLSFLGHEFYAPQNIEGFLEDRYGKGWVTPDPTYEL